MKEHVLPEFQLHLLQKSLFSDKYIPFYAHWAIKFMLYSSEQVNLRYELNVEKFLDYLKSRELTGHKNRETTMSFRRAIRELSEAPESPLDSLHEDRETNA